MQIFADAVDYKLISICHKGDVVVSQDYGVAAMALGKGITRSGGHRFCTDRSGNGDTRKRTEEDDVRFSQSFEKLMLIKNQADLDAFKKMYGINGEIEKEY